MTDAVKTETVKPNAALADRAIHLQLVHAVILRSDAQSFQTKVWAVALTLAAALVAGSLRESSLIVLAVIPPLALWLLDTYYWRRGMLFTALYDGVRTAPEVDFDLDPTRYERSIDDFFSVARSTAMIAFYGPLACAQALLLMQIIRL